MIIFGTRNRFKTIKTGQFYCPHCRATRNYELKQAKRYFALYFVPLIPMGDLGEFVECQTCKQMFKPDVLNVQQPKPKLDVVESLNSIKSTLENGHPIEYAVRDLVSAGLERDVVLNVVKSAIGTARKICRPCNLTYANTVETCAECHHPLSEVPL
jgi:hypothetical protein